MWRLALILTLGFILAVGCKSTQPQESVTMLPTQVSPELIIVYDNNPFDHSLRTAWGFSCLIRLPDKTILFDTGGDGSTLLHNMKQLQINPEEIDAIVLSHIHGDHVGGLTGILKQNSAVTVYLLKSFPGDFKDQAKSLASAMEEVHEPEELFPGVYTTGELGNGIREQSLAIVTPQGLIIITGCAHPGIVNIIQRARIVTDTDSVYLAVGGFHLSGTPVSRIESIIDSFKDLAVQKVAPCHCSGEKARQLFKEHYGSNYIESGAGTRISLP